MYFVTPIMFNDWLPKKPSNLASHARSAAVDNLGTWKDTDSSFQRSRKIEGEKKLLHNDDIWWMLWMLFFSSLCGDLFEAVVSKWLQKWW